MQNRGLKVWGWLREGILHSLGRPARLLAWRVLLLPSRLFPVDTFWIRVGGLLAGLDVFSFLSLDDRLLQTEHQRSL